MDLHAISVTVNAFARTSHWRRGSGSAQRAGGERGGRGGWGGLIEEEVYEKMAQRILILTQGEVSQMEGGGVGRGWVEGGRRVSEGVRPRSPPSGADGDRDGDGEVEGGGGGGVRRWPC